MGRISDATINSEGEMPEHYYKETAPLTGGEPQQGEQEIDPDSGPTVKEWVDAGYNPHHYPPRLYDPKSTDDEPKYYNSKSTAEEIAAAVALFDAVKNQGGGDTADQQQQGVADDGAGTDPAGETDTAPTKEPLP